MLESGDLSPLQGRLHPWEFSSLANTCIWAFTLAGGRVLSWVRRAAFLPGSCPWLSQFSCHISCILKITGVWGKEGCSLVAGGAGGTWSCPLPSGRNLSCQPRGWQSEHKPSSFPIPRPRVALATAVLLTTAPTRSYL